MLGHLKRVMDRHTDSLSGSVVLALCGDVYSLSLLRSFGTCFMKIITNKEGCSLREMRIMFDADRRMSLERCAEKAPMVTKVAEHPGWAKMWNTSLILEWKAVMGL